MKTKKEKKGFFERLTGKKKTKKGLCGCCNFQIEEISDKDDGSEAETRLHREHD